MAKTSKTSRTARTGTRSKPASHRAPASRNRPIPRKTPMPTPGPRPAPGGKTAPGPIKHVVIIVKENHTFDNYFGKFPGANGDATLAPAPDPPASDHPHDHHAWLNRASGATREQYAQSNIPAYWAYARQFTLCDRYFTAVAGPSTPNHLMLITADSPIINNPHYRDPVTMRPPFDIPSLPQSLRQAGFSWRSYGSYAHQYITALQRDPNNLTAEHFARDAAAGQLPTVSWVYAPKGLSEHPAEIIKDGMNWTVQQVNAVVQGGLWPSTAIVITWDDWGGWYDHVAPPNVESWTDGTQFRYGSRVPCLLLGPYAKSGYVSSMQHSHISVVKFCEVTFALKALNARDQASDGLEDCFDFTQKPLGPPSAA